MPSDTQNQNPTETSLPPSLQEPTADAPIPTTDSIPAEVPSGAPESSPNDFSAKSDNMPPSNSTHTEAENEPKTEEKQASNESDSEPVSEPKQASQPQTAQTSVNEPLEESHEQAKPASVNSKSSLARQLLISARNAIQFRKRKKLDRIMSLFLQHSKITNDEVEKFLHVSDATATRYLSILEKEGKIKQNGKTGHMVSYSRI